MQVTYHAVNVDIRPEERQQIERELERVEAFVRHFPQTAYHVEVERSARKGGLGVSIHVTLPTRSLFATAWGGDIRSGVELAVDKLVRQSRKHLDRLRKDERAGAETSRTETFFAPPTIGDLRQARDLEDFTDQIAHHSARLHRFLRRELRLLRQAGQPCRGVSLPDVVEDAITYVYEHFSEKPADLSPDRWLVRRGLLILREEIERGEGEEAPGTPDAPSPGDTHEDWEELMGLTPPDLVPMDARPAEAAQASPELLKDRDLAQQATAEALSRLADPLRRSLVLRHLEGYQVPEIAYVLNTDEAQVERWLDEAEVSLQGRLKSWRRI